MSSSFVEQFRSAFGRWWREEVSEKGIPSAASLLAQNLWSFARDSTPERRRQRYGDMEYDWDHRVDTTGGTIGWRTRLLGVFLSPYQPTDPALFHEMMASLPIKFEDFTFVDLGSGKGRTLLMAAQYPFRKVVGVEILPALHMIAQQNLARHKNNLQRCLVMEAVCADATDFCLPGEPMVLYLFNPLPNSGLKRAITGLDGSVSLHPRRVYIIYHNPLLEHVLAETKNLKKVCGTPAYSIFACGNEEN